MAYISAMAQCIACRCFFNFNPDRVPSIRVNGVREPVCRDCVERANIKRKENGLPPIVPLPGAYDAEECE